MHPPMETPLEPMTAWAVTLGHLPLAQWLRDGLWTYPVVSALHIVGIALLLGCVVALDARLLGWRAALPLPVVARAVWPWSVVGVALAGSTGALLFLVQPVDYLVNPAFVWKFLFLMGALTNVAVFHVSFPGVLDGRRPVTTGVRVVAGLSLLLWLSVLMAGRFVAFV